MDLLTQSSPLEDIGNDNIELFSNNNSEHLHSYHSRQLVSVVITSSSFIINICILLFIVSQRQLRTVSNAIFCSTCISGAITASIVTSADLLFKHYLMFVSRNVTLCAIMPALELTSFCIFNLNVTLMSFERCYFVVYPFKYRRLATLKNFTILITLSWLLPIFISALLFLSKIAIWDGSCYVWIYSVYGSPIFKLFLLPVTIFAPPSVMLITYCFIIWKIYSMQRQIWSETDYGINHQNSSKFILILQHKKAIYQMFILLTSYSFCFFPYFILICLLQNSWNDIKSMEAMDITFNLLLIYLSVYPILAINFNNLIKNEFKKIMKQVRVSLHQCVCNKYNVKTAKLCLDTKKSKSIANSFIQTPNESRIIVQ